MTITLAKKSIQINCAYAQDYNVTLGNLLLQCQYFIIKNALPDYLNVPTSTSS